MNRSPPVRSRDRGDRANAGICLRDAMISYRFKRRAFLAALGGGFGLRAMFRNGEVSAQAAQSPPRFLFSHWPVGIIAGAQDALFKPTVGAAGGYALQPFADNGLADDMITIRNVSTTLLPLNGAGGSEGGMVVLVTGVGCGGTRENRGESDDGFATGPSIDQYLLAKVPALRVPAGGPGYANAICDARTDLGEISAKCLSYSTEKRPVPLFSPAGTFGTENVPLLGTLSPFMQYTSLFSGMAPGSGTGLGGQGGSAGTAGAAGSAGPLPAADAMLKQLALRRSVLDFSLQEISRMSALVPGRARDKLRIHFDAVEEIEKGLTRAIEARKTITTGTGGGAGSTGGMGGAGGSAGDHVSCAVGMAPPAGVEGMPDWTVGGHGNYGTPKNGSTDDMATHETVGRLHMDVLRAAFVCDLIRCGTFQWSPSTNHVGFKGLYPGDEAGIYQHHPTSHSGNYYTNVLEATTPSELTVPAGRFLFNVQNWYFARHAENLKRWKEAVDGSGNPLLGTTLVVFTTENADQQNRRANIPCMLFGGRKLGMKAGQYVQGAQTINGLFGTIAQALGHTSTDAPLGVPIPGLWSNPAGG
jgi:hypothetical protein